MIIIIWPAIVSIGGHTDLYFIRNGSLTAQRYCDVILEPIVHPYTAAIDQEFIFMDDNDRPDCANLVQDIVRIDWPAVHQIVIQSNMPGMP